MNNIKVLGLIFVITNILFSQSISEKSINIDSINNKSIAEHNHVCGNILFKKEMDEIRKYKEMHPNYVKKTRRLQKPHTFTEGDKKSWWVQKADDSFVELESTCMVVGEHCYIFVSDESINDNKVTSDQIDQLVEAFDNSTPNFNGSGIYDVDVANFGAPSDFDGDPKIVIFLYDIEDDFDTTGSAILGYFWGKDLYDDGDPAIGNLRSNEGEIFYIDTYPLLDETIFGVNQAKSTLAHEFQHMIHENYDPDEMTFVNEGLSEIAEHICGYGVRSNSLYTQNTNRNLLSWNYDDTLPDYSRASFWTLYLYEQFPNSNLLKDLVDENNGDWTRLDNTIRMTGQARGLITLFTEWLIANYADGLSNDSRYNYTYTPQSKPSPVKTHLGNSGSGSGLLQPLSAEYVTFTGGDNLDITITGDNIIKVKALKIGSNEYGIDDVTVGTPYSPTGYGTTYSEVTFLIYNDSPGATQSYSYVAAGGDSNVTLELAYESGVPDGSTLNLNPSDSVAVQFDGQEGFFIDSIKIAFRQDGTIPIFINEYNNISYGSTISPLGDALVTPTIHNINLDTAPGWYTVDLSTESISADSDFIVGVELGADPSIPGIGAVAETASGSDHTWMYSPAGFGSRAWYNNIGNSGGDGSWKYMIRAFISNRVSLAIDPSGIVSIPNDFSLGANYPNPFNPSTTFYFATPYEGVVNFTVYDLLGQVIYSENRNLLAGNYQFNWDGQNQLDQQVVSGVYFLQMEADGFTQTRKMLMMK